MAVDPRFVDRTYVLTHEGVYFLVYSVPQMIATNIGLKSPEGGAAAIFHQSIVFSDGRGTVQTITAGPSDGQKWYKQIGLTPIQVQVAFLSHPDKAEIEDSFDTTAWRDSQIRQYYFKSNWQRTDFILATRLARLHAARIARIGYNLGGRNSNSVASFVWSRVSRHPASTLGADLDSPLTALDCFFRPGSRFDIFRSGPGLYLHTLANWAMLTVLGIWALCSTTVQTIRPTPR